MYAYCLIYSILNVILHPFLREKDYLGYIKIISIIESKCKTVFLGIKKSLLFGNGIVIASCNLNFLKNIMFVVPFESLRCSNIDEFQKDLFYEQFKAFKFNIFKIVSNLNFEKLISVSSFVFITSKTTIFTLIIDYYFFYKYLISKGIIIENEQNKYLLVLLKSLLENFKRTSVKKEKIIIITEFLEIILHKIFDLQEVTDFTYIDRDQNINLQNHILIK
ncbi:hypothetical protein GVAV_002215 [Gurleya vavrai]